MKAIEIRIYPNQQQRNIIHQTFGCVRFLWNQFLGMSVDRYRNNPDLAAVSQYGYNYLIPAMKNQYNWLKLVDSTSLQIVSQNLANAYKRFFKTKRGFPKFKVKRFERRSYQSKGTCVQIDAGHLKLAKLGIVKARNHRFVTGKIKEFTIKQTKSGKYFAVLIYESENQTFEKTGKTIGIDLGVSDLVIGSKDDIRFKTIRFDKIWHDRLAYWQRRHARRLRLAKAKGLDVNACQNVEKAKLMVAKYHEKIANARKNYLHHISKQLINDYDAIYMEDLKTLNMMKNHNLAQAIANQSWRELRTQLDYKSKLYGRYFAVVNPYKTSQWCSDCGYDDGYHALHIREWTCPNCHVLHDRDVNAAKNIERLGLEQTLVK